MHYSCSHVYEFDFPIMIFMTMNLTQYIPAKKDWCQVNRQGYELEFIVMKQNELFDNSMR